MTKTTTRSASRSNTSDGLSTGRYWGDEPHRGHLYAGPEDPSPSVEVRESTWIPATIGEIPTTRRGLYATRRIQAGTAITPYAGVGTDLPMDISNLHPSTTSHYKTLMHVPTGHYVIDGFREPRLGFGLAQFCNAGNTPQMNNAYFKGTQAEAADTTAYSHATLGIYIVASKTIEAGEEILTSYDRHYWIRMQDEDPEPIVSTPPNTITRAPRTRTTHDTDATRGTHPTRHKRSLPTETPLPSSQEGHFLTPAPRPRTPTAGPPPRKKQTPPLPNPHKTRREVNTTHESRPSKRATRPSASTPTPQHVDIHSARALDNTTTHTNGG